MVGEWCTYDYKSKSLDLKTAFDLDLDFGLTIVINWGKRAKMERFNFY